MQSHAVVKRLPNIVFVFITMANAGRAFSKGGIGCLVVFFVLALLAVAFGGTANLDIGGVVILFLVGGVIGLIVNWIYQKGKEDAFSEEE